VKSSPKSRGKIAHLQLPDQFFISPSTHER
jgi:hypothetical protein